MSHPAGLQMYFFNDLNRHISEKISLIKKLLMSKLKEVASVLTAGTWKDTNLGFWMSTCNPVIMNMRWQIEPEFKDIITYIVIPYLSNNDKIEG